jgi:hypothetical protein
MLYTCPHTAIAATFIHTDMFATTYYMCTTRISDQQPPRLYIHMYIAATFMHTDMFATTYVPHAIVISNHRKHIHTDVYYICPTRSTY